MWKRFRDPHSKMRTSSNLKLRLNASHEKRFKPAMPPAIWLIVCLVWAPILDAATGPARAQQQTITVLIEASFQASARRFLEQLSKNLPEEARDNVRFISTVVPSSEIQARLHLLPSWTMAILSTNTLTNEKVRTTAAGFDMPFIFSNMSSVTALQHSHIGRAGLSTMSEQGMTGLVYLNAGLTLLANRRDPFLTRPTDLNERKVAVFSLAQAEPFKQFGSFPTLSERAKAQGAVESGAVDSVAINSVNASTWVFPARGSLLIDSIKAQVAVVVTQDKSWSEIPFVYRAMMGDAAIAASQSLDRELVEMERPLFDKAKLSGVDLVSFKPEDASRATQQWISVQPVSLRGIYESVYEYVKKAGSPSPQTPIVPNRRGQTGTLYFATTRDDTNHGNISYRFGDARTNVVKCGQIEFSQNNPSMSTATLVAPVTANTQTCGTILNTALQASERMLFFVHGFNNRFSDAAERAMILKNALGNDTEVVMWSWPSKRDGLAGNYNYDRESVTGEAQRELMNIFQALEMGSAEKPLILLSHSMGGWHVLGALQTLSDQHRGPKFRDVILAAPDIPADEFSFAFDALNSTTKRSTLYACAWDGALILSEELNDYRRAGTGGNNIDSRMGMDSIDVDSRLSLNHSYVFDNERVLRDVAALILTGANPGMVERGLIKVPKGSWHYWHFP